MHHAPPPMPPTPPRPTRAPLWIAPLVLLAALAAPAAAAAAAGPAVPALFADAAAPAVGALRSAPLARGELAAREVRVDVGLLTSVPAALRLDLGEVSGGSAPVARRTGADHHPDDGGWLTWRGRIDPGAGESAAGGEVLLTVHRGRVAGRIVTPAGALWQLMPDAAGGHRLTRLDAAAFPPCGGGLDPAEVLAPLEAAAETPVAAPASGTEIGMMVLYTPTARSEAGGRGPIEALVRLGIDLLNQATANSGNNVRFVLHRTAEYAAPYAGESIALSPFASDPVVAAMRDQAAADVVTLVLGRGDRASEGLCGIAFVMSRNRVGPNMAPRAFNLVVRDCYGPNLTLAHEVGHNMGAQHEPGPNSGPPELASFPWSYGHVVDGSFRTIMAYSTSCAERSGSCPRGTFFSNPDRSHAGHPTGVPDERDVHRTFSATAGIVAAFRSGSAPGDGPAAPTELGSAAESATQVFLAWVDNSDDEVDFEVQLQPAGEPFRQAAVVAADETHVLLEGLAPDTDYRFRIRARNDDGVSAFSNEAESTTPTVAPSALVATALSGNRIELNWTVEAREGISYHAEISRPTAPPEVIAPLEPEIDPGLGPRYFIDGLEMDTPYSFRVRTIGPGGASEWSKEASATTDGASGPCVAGDRVLCLLGGRFEVRARWRNPHRVLDSGVGHAQPVPGSDRTGSFWFFAPDNVELLVKLLDGRPVNGRFWHLYGALTDVEYWVLVRDTAIGATRTYHNPAFQICGGADDDAFEGTAPAPPGALRAAGAVRAAPIAAAADPLGTLPGAGSAGACEPGPTTLCLLGGRFQVEVDWINPRIEGDAGPGHRAEGAGTDRTGYFWFFRPDNLELAVKALDGRVVNGHFWLFWAGLSDVEYVLRVTDTTTGVESEFVNPAFSLCGGAATDTL